MLYKDKRDLQAKMRAAGVPDFIADYCTKRDPVYSLDMAMGLSSLYESLTAVYTGDYSNQFLDVVRNLHLHKYSAENIDTMLKCMAFDVSGHWTEEDCSQLCANDNFTERDIKYIYNGGVRGAASTAWTVSWALAKADTLSLLYTRILDKFGEINRALVYNRVVDALMHTGVDSALTLYTKLRIGAMTNVTDKVMREADRIVDEMFACDYDRDKLYDALVAECDGMSEKDIVDSLSDTVEFLYMKSTVQVTDEHINSTMRMLEANGICTDRKAVQKFLIKKMYRAGSSDEEFYRALADAQRELVISNVYSVPTTLIDQIYKTACDCGVSTSIDSIVQLLATRYADASEACVLKNIPEIIGMLM